MILHLCWPCTARVGTVTCIYVMCGKIHKTCQFAKFGSLAKITSVRKSITNMFWQTFTRKVYSCHFIKKPETQMHSQKENIGQYPHKCWPKMEVSCIDTTWRTAKTCMQSLVVIQYMQFGNGMENIGSCTQEDNGKGYYYMSQKNIKYNSGKCKKSHTLSLKTQVQFQHKNFMG